MPTCYRHPGREAHIRCQRCDRVICPDCMRSAAVGFQCPECVAIGVKQTRSGRTPYGGAVSRNPALTSLVLIAVNAAVWILITLTGGADSVVVEKLALIPLGQCSVGGGSYYSTVSEAVCATARRAPVHWVPGVADGAWWQLGTSVFTHVEIWHIGFNMLALWFLGPQLELILGRARFLAVYLLSGLAGSTLVYWLAPVHQSSFGASGAVFGLMGALLLVAVKLRGNAQQILMWIGLNFLITVLGRGFISWQAHLGGFLGGLLLAAILLWAPRERRTAVQVGGLAAVAVGLLVAVAVRTTML